MPTRTIRKERYSGSSIPEVFLVDLHNVSGVRVAKLDSADAVLNLVSDLSSDKGKTTIDCIQRYKAGTYEIVEMDVVFRGGRLMLVEKV